MTSGAADSLVGGSRLTSQILGPDTPRLPDGLFLVCRVLTSTGLGWLTDRAPFGREKLRLEALLGHLDRLQRKVGDTSAWWTLACLRDGWREDGGPPSGHDLPWDRSASVLCFGRRLDDPSALLVAEPHFFMYGRYRRLKAKVRLLGLPWAMRKPAAVYAGGDHGRLVRLPGGGATTPRRLLARTVAEQELPVTVSLGRGVSVAEQMRHRVILDVDGQVRTWEAWAWKMLSGSVVLSQTSMWHTRFTSEFKPGTHYLPVGEDFGDLREVLDWCQAHWADAHEVARQARRAARTVYSTGWVESPAEWRRISAALHPLAMQPGDKRLV